ncbi:MAG: DmsC/YnfH family molybdoenzyme membrane anchor subunit [Pseudomonadota bacterium]
MTPIWEMRPEEQSYALLSDKDIKKENRYGEKIDLLELNPSWAEGQSLFINDNPEVGCNANRNKQHGFFFTADNCIGCHACEAACSEKNDNPGHIAFRSVGYVEGGSYPDYTRMNISMACNHCDDPVCLKGCPTNAYIKHTEYGAVLQDPETCFGCGYCTWVCPYNAPQLDPIKGQVSKCNMCVDRLEVGLKPACVSACLGNALDFGVIENIPENREEAKVSIPGFPDPEITHPNIRFQQTKRMPEEVTRTDSEPVKYHRDEAGNYKPRVDQKAGKERHWNLARLNSRENPLVLFTLLTQTAIGAFTISFLGSLLGVESLEALRASPAYALLSLAGFVIASVGMFLSATHLGKPMRFYRGFNNLKYSPVCREGLGVAVFIAMLGLHVLFSLPGNSIFQNLFQALFGTAIGDLIAPATAHSIANVMGVLALLGAAPGLYYMVKCYRIRARPFWNHWQVAADFCGASLALGAATLGTAALMWQLLVAGDYSALLTFSAVVVLLGQGLHAVGLRAHAAAMQGKDHEGAVSHYIQTTTFGKTYVLRNIGVAVNLLLAVAVIVSASMSLPLVIALLWSLLMLTLVGTSLIGRALFYVLVVPTTMPGAFFWKNKGFEQHARDIGLAAMPQVGVVMPRH